MRRIVKILIPVLILAGLIGWRVHLNKVSAQALQTNGGGGGGRGGGRGNRSSNVSVGKVQMRDIVHTFSTTANIESPQTVKLSPKIAGVITQITVKEGDPVQIGQVLVKLDDSELQAAVRKNQAMLAVARAHLLQTQATQSSTLTPLATQIVQNQAAVRSAEASYNQLSDTFAQQVAAADALVTDAQSKVASAAAAVVNAQAAQTSAEANAANANTSLTRQTALLDAGAVAKQDVDNARTTAAVQAGSVGVAKAQVNAAQANLQSAQAQLKSAQNQATITKRKSRSDIAAAHASLVQAEQQLKNSKANTDQRAAYHATVAGLQADVQSAQADLITAQVQLSQTVIKSTINGFVSSRLADPGTLASPGTPVMNLQALKQVWVNVPIPQEQIAQISQGQDVTVTIDSLTGQKFHGRIFQINPSGDPSSRDFTVRVALDNDKAELKPGMFARISLDTEHIRGATVVPLEGIKKDDEGSYVWLFNAADSTIHRQAITIGASDDNGSQVLSGVKPGDQIVTVGGTRLKDGAKVTLGGVGGAGKDGKGGKGGHGKRHPQSQNQ